MRKKVSNQPKKYNIIKAYVQYHGLDGAYAKNPPDGGLSKWPAVMLVNWTAEGIGFGQLTFYEKKGRLHCDTECMSKEFVKAVLDKLLEGAKYVDK